ncbi:MAG: accessory Sec system protein Asp3 [Lachnospiraceae bacterium]|nr:accessory Sec system protein Asp3 [Lachnospiraceae bacterium]
MAERGWIFLDGWALTFRSIESEKRMEALSWRIFWNNYFYESYLYGSKVDFVKKDEVHYKNDLMPPGTVIKTWRSRTNFQADKTEPTLPLIDGESSYSFQLNCDSDVAGGLQLRLTFFDRNGQKIGEKVMREREMILQCPIQTYNYDVSLIGSGAHEFCFHYIEITELTD